MKFDLICNEVGEAQLFIPTDGHAASWNWSDKKFVAFIKEGDWMITIWRPV